MNTDNQIITLFIDRLCEILLQQDSKLRDAIFRQLEINNVWKQVVERLSEEQIVQILLENINQKIPSYAGEWFWQEDQKVAAIIKNAESIATQQLADLIAKDMWKKRTE